ncbi:MAG: hypothetical protein PUF72_02920 [Clostridiales bacterium]|nr:hypothetical protein [Clostridiales bacterium]
MALCIVDGTALPAPSTYSASNSDLVDSGRNEEGVLVCDVLRYDIAKIELSWKTLSPDKWAAVLALFKTSFFHSVTYYDQTEDAYKTKEMYVSDRKAELLKTAGGKKYWKDCKLSLVEV